MIYKVIKHVPPGQLFLHCENGALLANGEQSVMLGSSGDDEFIASTGQYPSTRGRNSKLLVPLIFVVISLVGHRKTG